MGEVYTGLLQHSSAASPDLVTRLLEFKQGERVWSVRRPIDYARSPETLTGVDCLLPTANRAKVRGVGTVLARAAITGGQIAQGTAYTTVAVAATIDRRPWSHYLSRRGVVETIGRAEVSTVADGFVADGSTDAASPGQLNLGAIATAALDRVLHRPELDHRPAFRSTRSRVRFVITAEPSDVVTFGVDDAKVRRLRLPQRGSSPNDVIELCEDLALHDWLLTTLVDEVDRSLVGASSRRQAAKRLAPVLDHLGHLWMPAARVNDDLADIWRALEHRPGLSRQWRATVNRVRDHMALAALEPTP